MLFALVPVSALSAGKTRWRVRISLHSKELRSVTTKKGPTHVLNATFFDASGFIKLVWWGDRVTPGGGTPPLSSRKLTRTKRSAT